MGVEPPPSGAGRPMVLSQSKMLWVLPVDARVEQELRDRALGRGAGVAGVSGADVVTLDGLSEAIVQHARVWAVDGRGRGSLWWSGRRQGSRREVELAARRVVRVFYREARGVFSRFAQRNGFIDALMEFFDECRAGGVRVRQLAAFVEHMRGRDDVAEHRLARLAELSELYTMYDGVLAERGLLDDGLVVQVAIEALEDDSIPLPSVLRGRSQVQVRDIYAWRPVEVDLAQALSRRLASERGSAGMDRVVLRLPYDLDRPSLFHYLEGTLRHLESLEGASLSVEWDASPNRSAAPPLQALAGAIWTDHRPDLLGYERDEDDTIEGLSEVLRVIEAPGERRQARAVARRVRELLEDGVAPEDITIAVRGMDSSVEQIGDALEVYGVGWSHDFEVQLGATPLAQLALQLVRLVQESFPRELFIEVLTSWAMSRVFPEQQELYGVATDAVQRADRERLLFNHELARVLRSLGIRDNQTDREDYDGGYAERLDLYVDRKRIELEEQRQRRLAEGQASPEDELPVEADEAFSRARLIRDRVVGFVRRVQTWLAPGQRSVGEHAAGLKGLLDELNVADAVSARGVMDQALRFGRQGQAMDRRLIRALSRDLQALRSLGQVLDELVGQPLDPDDPGMELVEFADLLERLFLHERWAPSVDRAGGCVRLVPVEQLCGLRAPHLILVGLTEGTFPRVQQGKPLFTDEERFAFAGFEKEVRRQMGDDTMRSSFQLKLPIEDELMFDEPLAPVPSRLAEEALLFYFGLRAATRSLTLTYSDLDAIGRRMVRSVFVEAVLNLVPEEEMGQVVVHEALDPVPKREHCVAPWELACRYALDTRDWRLARDPGRTRLDLDPEPIEELFEAATVPALDIRLATGVEEVRQRLATLPNEVLTDEVEGSPYRAWCGVVDDRHQGWLEEVLRFGAESPLSHRAMDGFRRCPQRFFFSRVLHLRQEHHRGLEVSRMDRSRLVHDVIERVLRTLEREELLPDRVELDVDRGAALRRAEEVVEGELDRWEERRNLAHPMLWEKERRDTRRLTLALVHRVLNNRGERQVAAPWGFGRGRFTSQVDVEAVPIQLGDEQLDSVSVAGEVDRVVLRQLSGRTVLELIDYGTASARGMKTADKQTLVTSYELPMAMLAAIDGLVPRLRAQGQVGSELVVSAVRESVLDGKRGRPLRAVLKEEDGHLKVQSRGLERARDQIAASVQEMRRGRFPFATRDCSHCAFRRTCRRGNYPEMK